jgi:hypothetical protein
MLIRQSRSRRGQQAVGWFFIAAWLCGLTGCTSIGHGGREKPLIARQIDPISEITLDGDDNELAIAIEKALDDSGIKVRTVFAPRVTEKSDDREVTYSQLGTRYVIRVQSDDYDICLPEGSRQMDFSIVVTDYEEHRRVLVMRAKHGCKNSIVNRFMKWLESNQGSDS